MPRKVSEIVEEARQLPYGERAELIEQLILANQLDADPKVEKAWADTAMRRLAEIESGKEKLIPGDQVAAEIRKIVGLGNLTPSIERRGKNTRRPRRPTPAGHAPSVPRTA